MIIDDAPDKCEQIGKSKETAGLTDVRNPTTARTRDSVRSDRRNRLRVRNGRRTYARTLTIPVRRELGNPEKTRDLVDAILR